MLAFNILLSLTCWFIIELPLFSFTLELVIELIVSLVVVSKLVLVSLIIPFTLVLALVLIVGFEFTLYVVFWIDSVLKIVLILALSLAFWLLFDAEFKVKLERIYATFCFPLANKYSLLFREFNIYMRVKLDLDSFFSIIVFRFYYLIYFNSEF